MNIDMDQFVAGLLKRAKIKSGMIRMGEPIEFGSDTDIIDELVDAIGELVAERDALREALRPLAGIHIGVSMNDDAPVAYPVIGDMKPLLAKDVRAARTLSVEPGK